MILEKSDHILRRHLFKEISVLILRAAVKVTGGFDSAMDIASECESKLFYVDSPGHQGWIERYREQVEHDAKFRKSLKEYIYSKVKKQVQKERKKHRNRESLVEEKAAHVVGDAQIEIPSANGSVRNGHALWSRCEPDQEDKYEAKQIFDMLLNESVDGSSPLTMRERKVVMKIIEGESRREISDALGVSRESVRRDIESVLVKVGILSTALVACFSFLGHRRMLQKNRINSNLSSCLYTIEYYISGNQCGRSCQA